eukprot:5011948-Amphidinium_carterae.1
MRSVHDTKGNHSVAIIGLRKVLFGELVRLEPCCTFQSGERRTATGSSADVRNTRLGTRNKESRMREA